MTVDVAAVLAHPPAAEARTPSRLAQGLVGSSILKIAGEVAVLKSSGAAVSDFTVGDFSPAQFRVPPALESAIREELAAGNTNYPPAVGSKALRDAVRALYVRELGLDYPDGCVQIGSGARPPIYGLFKTLVDPGDKVVYPVPSWNNKHYTYLCGGVPVPVATRPEDGFMPSAAALAQHLPTARLLCLNSPLNPSGTAISESLLRELCEAVLAENARRAAAGERALFVFYDQVYWQLTFGDTRHLTPVALYPEMAHYTVFVDAISKCWAATGLRVGWAVGPKWVIERMGPLIGHMGAWAALPEQLASARLLREPALMGTWMADFQAAVTQRLDSLYAGLMGLQAEGLPVDALTPQGAIYLTAKVDLIGRTLADGRVLDEDGVRQLLLTEAGVAVVPFSAFDYPAGSGWMRFSVGAVSVADCEAAIQRLGALLRRVL